MQELIAQVQMAREEAIKLHFKGTLQEKLNKQLVIQLVDKLIESNLIRIEKYEFPDDTYISSVTYVGRIFIEEG